MKLIYTGKVLKDTQTIAECELKPNAFLVVMITKVSVNTNINIGSLFSLETTYLNSYSLWIVTLFTG
jgi:hypothetical protein